MCVFVCVCMCVSMIILDCGCFLHCWNLEVCHFISVISVCVLILMMNFVYFESNDK